MCGIVYVKRKDGIPAYRTVLKRYRSQKTRGQDGFGYIAIKDNQVVSYERAPTEHEIIKKLEKEDAPEIMFHHRYPTSTPNIEEAAHPLLVENPILSHQYFVLHNGVIKNTKELREAHYKLGIKYNTEIMKGFTALSSKKMYQTEIVWNDSESLAIETALAMDGLKATIDTEGAAAVVGVQTKGRQVINRFIYRNDNHPLMYHEDKVMISITSLGAGTNLPPLLVYKLRPEGGYVHYGDKAITTPKGYTYQPTYGRTAEFYKTHEWDKDLKEYVLKENKTPINYPHESFGESIFGMGFGRRNGFKSMNELISSSEDRDDIDFDPNPQDTEIALLEDEIGKSMRQVASVSDEISVIERRISKGFTFIGSLTIDVLYSEHDLSVEVEEILKKTLKQMDVAIENGEPTEEMYDEREKIQTKLQTVVDYLSKVQIEITVRESMAERMLK